MASLRMASRLGGQDWDRHEIPSVRGPVALVPKEANTGKSGAGGYSIGPDRGKLVEIPPVAGAKRQRWTASDTAGNQEIGRLYFPYAENRILFLAESFAVSVYSYAVMSNHTHIVLSVDPNTALAWSDEEVADRWLQLFPGALARADSEAQRQRIRYGLLSTPDRLNVLRKRLGSLSWFMRALNEPIARMANQEDGCTGRFWEGALSVRPCSNRMLWFLRWPTSI